MRSIAFAMVLLGACGGGPTIEIPDGGSVGVGSAASVSHDLGPADDAAGATTVASDGGSTTPLDGTGNVFVYLTQATSSGYEYESTSVGATFYETVAGQGGVCSTAQHGGCTVTTCTGVSTSTTTPPQAGGGDVTISGGNDTETIVTDTNSTETISTLALLWMGGDALTVQSTGATVGPFMQSLVVPDPIVLTSPYLATDEPVALSRSEAIAIDWSGGISGDAVFRLGQSVGSTSVSAECRFPASQSHATFPVEVLQAFAVGASIGFSADTESTASSHVGNWLVTSGVYWNGVYDDGTNASGSMVLQ